MTHMPTAHGFDFFATAKTLDFHSRIKLVNYMRRMQAFGRCFICAEPFCDLEEAERHFASPPEAHRLDASMWQDAQYLFPTLEDDPILQLVDLDDVEYGAGG
jgi:hypothetical protein